MLKSQLCARTKPKTSFQKIWSKATTAPYFLSVLHSFFLLHTKLRWVMNFKTTDTTIIYSLLMLSKKLSSNTGSGSSSLCKKRASREQTIRVILWFKWRPLVSDLKVKCHFFPPLSSTNTLNLGLLSRKLVTLDFMSHSAIQCVTTWLSVWIFT